MTAHCKAWGAAKGARRVYGLTESEKETVRAGGLVIIHNCPPVFGHTTRRVIEKNGAFYARLPERN